MFRHLYWNANIRKMNYILKKFGLGIFNHNYIKLIKLKQFESKVLYQDNKKFYLKIIYIFKGIKSGSLFLSLITLFCSKKNI